MSELTPELANGVIEACQSGAEGAAAALGRALDGEFKLAVGEATTYSPSDVPEGFAAGGLVVLMKVGDSGAVAIIPESTGVLPEWIATADEQGSGKLDVLAKDLAGLLLPAALEVQIHQSVYVPHRDKSLSLAKVGEPATLVPLEITRGEQSGQLSVIWPLNYPEKILADGSETESPTTAADGPAQPRKIPKSFAELPPYSRSLLKVKVPVRVVLASRKETLKDVVEMSPGTLIKFEKACDQLLEMQVADQRVAEGEAVKVGDKFGFRVISMLLPEEHFLKIEGKEKRAS